MLQSIFTVTLTKKVVRFNNYVESVEINKLPCAWKIKCSHMEAVGFILFSVPEKSLRICLAYFSSALSQGL